MEQFHCSTRIVAGAGCMAALSELKSRRLLLVSDPYFVKNGVAQQVLQLSGAEHTAVFDGIAPDPAVELVARGTALLRSFQPDTVVALGGGSAIDSAKSMVYFAGLGVTLVAIPTTSGSGSEVTDFAVLTHGGRKHPLVDARLRPSLAILDGSLLESLPPSLIADTGFDVLAHALEACAATGANGFTDALAEAAFREAFYQLPRSFSGEVAARLPLHRASTMAGVAFSGAGLGLCHAMAHALGGVFHLPHGRLNAILLPAVIRFNAGACAGKYARLASCAGLGGSAEAVAVRGLVNGLSRLRRQLELPQTLAQAGIPPAAVDRPQLTQAVLADPCCSTNPVPVTARAVGQLLKEVAGGGK